MTTKPLKYTARSGVISFFYIKPQQILVSANLKDVVLYPSSTSNHNSKSNNLRLRLVVLYPSSTSNHNCFEEIEGAKKVVLYPSSTSNHNLLRVCPFSPLVVLYPSSTSNHNLSHTAKYARPVVLYPSSTSNHNLGGLGKICLMLCYILLLHQTTTLSQNKVSFISCVISFFYIKPQPI